MPVSNINSNGVPVDLSDLDNPKSASTYTWSDLSLNDALNPQAITQNTGAKSTPVNFTAPEGLNLSDLNNLKGASFSNNPDFKLNPNQLGFKPQPTSFDLADTSNRPKSNAGNVASIVDMVSPQPYKSGQAQYDALIKLMAEQTKQDATQVDRDKQINDLNFIKKQFEKTEADSNLKALFNKAYGSSLAIDTDTKKPVEVNYAQRLNFEGPNLELQKWASDLFGIGNGTLGVATPMVAWGTKGGVGWRGGFGGGVGWGGQLINASLFKLVGGIEKADGNKNAYDANDNPFTRLVNFAGDKIGDWAPSVEANVDARILDECLLGVGGSRTSFYAGFGNDLSARIEPRLIIKSNPKSFGPNIGDSPQNTSTYVFGSIFGARASQSFGPQISRFGPGLFSHAESAGAYPYVVNLTTPPIKGGEAFVGNLSGMGLDTNSEDLTDAEKNSLRAFQKKFTVKKLDEDSLVTVDIANRNFYQNTPNASGSTETVLKTGDSEGKNPRTATELDKVLAGHYTRVEDVVRWINEIGKQNADNQNAMFQLVTADDIKKANPNLVKTLVVEGKKTDVISDGRIVTPVVRDKDGILDIAKSINLGGGKTVHLKPRY